MKRIFAITLLLVAFRASAQQPVSISAQFADKFAGNVMSVYGYAYKLSYDNRTHTMLIEFGSKNLEKGITLKLTNDSKLQANNVSFQDLKGHFMTVTGKLYKNKNGKVCIDGDDPKTSINIQQSLAYN
ncbi:MAG: hypothetical protein JSU01_21700 [Bacteroidetes bacterium]|nr:hypothetical protein [Bacteroidota bacterium]